MSERRFSIPEKVGFGVILLIGSLGLGSYREAQEEAEIASVFSDIRAAAHETYADIAKNPGKCRVDNQDGIIYGPNGESLEVSMNTDDFSVTLRHSPESSALRMEVGPDGIQDDGYVRVNDAGEFHTSNPNTSGIGETVPAAKGLLAEFQNNC